MKLSETVIFVFQIILLIGSSQLAVAASNTSHPANSPSGYNRCDFVSEQTPISPMRLHCLLASSDDAYVENLSPLKTYGDLPVLIVQAVPSMPTLKDYSYLKFDLEDAVPSQLIQSNARPGKVTLSMYVEWINFFYNATVQIHHVTSNSWDEDSVTWNNRPDFDVEILSEANVRIDGTWAHWNVTSNAINTLRNSTQLSFAAIASERSWRSQVLFASRELPSQPWFKMASVRVNLHRTLPNHTYPNSESDNKHR